MTTPGQQQAPGTFQDIVSDSQLRQREAAARMNQAQKTICDLPPVREQSMVIENRNRNDEPPTFRSDAFADPPQPKPKKLKNVGVMKGVFFTMWVLLGVASIVSTYFNLFRTKSCKIEMKN
jgi:hypothetical protein